MTAPNPIPWVHLYNDTAAKFAGIRDNAATIENAFALEATRMHEEGLLIADVPAYDAYKIKWFVELARAESKNNGQMVRKHLMNSDTVPGALDLGDAFDRVITVCNAPTLNDYFGVKEYFSGRRVPLGRLDDLDLRLMRQALHRACRPR